MASPQENTITEDLDKFLPVTSKCLQILKYKSVLWYAIASFTWFSSLSLGVLVYGFINPSKKFWLTYGLIPFAAIFLIIQLIVCIICFCKWEQTKLLLTAEFSWDLNILPTESKNKTLHMCKQIDAGFMIGCGVTGCGTFVVLKEITPFLWTLVSALEFMEKYIPHFRWIVIVNMWLGSTYMTFMALVAIYYLFVPVILFKIQLIMLYSVADILKKSKPKKHSDKFVEENLKNIIRMHQNILRIYPILKKYLFIPLLLISIALLILMMYNTIIFQSPYCGILSPIIIYCKTLILAAYFAYQGQKIQDLYDGFFTLLYDMNWYEWSINNMKIFKTLFLNASVSMTASDVALLEINHLYFTKCVKVMYTLISLARTFSHQ